MLADSAITADAREILQDMAQDHEDLAATLQATCTWLLDSTGGVGDWVLPKNGGTRSGVLSGKAKTPPPPFCPGD